MLSSLDRILHQAEAQRAGIDLFLSKPVKMQELDHTLNLLFDKKSSPDSTTPIAAPAPEPKIPVVFPSTNGNGNGAIHPTVIVAEDDPVNMLLISEVLSKMGCHVIKASNGKEAVERLEEEPCPAFILMDVNMPEMDGLEATRIIRNQAGPKATIPIIALTAGVMQKDKERCLAAGMDDIITKPFRLEEIRAVLELHVTPTPALREKSP
jgi:CheY-like chemotaxis protein